VLGAAKLQRREHRDIHGKPGGHADCHVNHPVRDMVQRLVTAEQQREHGGEGDLSALISQSAPAAEEDAGRRRR
jgi:hypothetical protein